jgi:hypothetical protein
VTNPDEPLDQSEPDVVADDPSPTTSPGARAKTVDIVGVREFTSYFLNRGLTFIEAVELWDELEEADITTGGEAPPVIRVHCGVAYALSFEWNATGSAEVVVAVTVLRDGDPQGSSG